MRKGLRYSMACAAVLLGLVGCGSLARAGATSTAGRIAATPLRPALGDLLTYDYDNARSGHDPVDPPIASLSAQPAWSDENLGQVYAEPLIYNQTAYVVTESDTIDAIDVHNGALRWSLKVGTPVPQAVVDRAPGVGCGDINPLGITGTPVIDPENDELFLAEETELNAIPAWQDIRHWLVAISLSSHKELWHRDIDPPRPNSASTYWIAAQQQRPAITLLNGRLYVPFGGLYGDCGQYHGYVVSLRESGAGAVLSYQVPTAREGAIWETNGLVVSAAGDLYFATGNGSSNNIADFDEGNSVVELSPELVRLSYWAPSDWVELNDQDWDLGSAGPITVPGTSLLFVAGKPAAAGSFGYLMTEGHLGGIGRGAYTAALCSSGGDFGANASDVVDGRVYIYAACGSGTQAVLVDTRTATFARVWNGAANGPPIVAGGLVFALNWDSGVLVAMNPTSGRVLLERPTSALEHFATPAVGDGHVLVPTAGGVEAFATIR